MRRVSRGSAFKHVPRGFPVPLSRTLLELVMGQLIPFPPVASCPTALLALSQACANPWCENPPACRLHTPLPPEPLPEAPQRVGMGPRNQARRLPADCPQGRQGPG